MSKARYHAKGARGKRSSSLSKKLLVSVKRCSINVDTGITDCTRLGSFPISIIFALAAHCLLLSTSYIAQ